MFGLGALILTITGDLQRARPEQKPAKIEKKKEIEIVNPGATP